MNTDNIETSAKEDEEWKLKDSELNSKPTSFTDFSKKLNNAETIAILEEQKENLFKENQALKEHLRLKELECESLSRDSQKLQQFRDILK